MTLPGGVVDEPDRLGACLACSRPRRAARATAPATRCRHQRSSSAGRRWRCRRFLNAAPVSRSSPSPIGGRDLRERHPGRDHLARLLVAGLGSRRRNVVTLRPGDPVDDEGVRALGLGRSGALPLPSVAGVADEHEGGRLAGGAPRQPRPRVPARLGHEEGRQVRSGWLAAAHAVGALRLAQLGAGAGVGEGHEPTPALERADVPTRIRAGWGELVEVASHRDGLAVELARPQQLISIGNADHRQASDLRWERPSLTAGARRSRKARR